MKIHPLLKKSIKKILRSLEKVKKITSFPEKLFYKVKFGGPINLNIGGGPGIKVEGWKILDYSRIKWGEGKKFYDINKDIRKGIPLFDSSCNYIYCSHFLEHLNWYEGRKFLEECYRVLVPGGKIRILVPNGDFFIKKFIERDEKFFNTPERCFNHWLGNITDTFLWNLFGAYVYKKRGFDRHAMLYNYENLSYRLKNLGFKNIALSGFNKSKESVFANEAKFFPKELIRHFGENNLIAEAEK
jgi:predicted SAM-dependent methyltransferase